MFKYIKIIIILLCVFTLACSDTDNKPLSIGFAKDSATVVITNIELSALRQLKNNINTDSAYQKVVTVLQTPGDNDSTSMEIDWPGMVSLAGDTLLFTPNMPFLKGKRYLVETIVNVEFGNAEALVKSKVGHEIKPKQQLLQR